MQVKRNEKVRKVKEMEIYYVQWQTDLSLTYEMTAVLAESKEQAMDDLYVTMRKFFPNVYVVGAHKQEICKENKPVTVKTVFITLARRVLKALKNVGVKV